MNALKQTYCENIELGQTTTGNVYSPFESPATDESEDLLPLAYTNSD